MEKYGQKKTNEGTKSATLRPTDVNILRKPFCKKVKTSKRRLKKKRKTNGKHDEKTLR